MVHGPEQHDGVLIANRQAGARFDQAEDCRIGADPYSEDDDDQIECLEEALDNLSFTEDLDRFELMAIDPDADLEELEEIDEFEEVEEDDQ